MIEIRSGIECQRISKDGTVTIPSPELVQNMHSFYYSMYYLFVLRYRWSTLLSIIIFNYIRDISMEREGISVLSTTCIPYSINSSNTFFFILCNNYFNT